jgi:hypothetical protein
MSLKRCEMRCTLTGIQPQFCCRNRDAPPGVAAGGFRGKSSWVQHPVYSNCDILVGSYNMAGTNLLLAHLLLQATPKILTRSVLWQQAKNVAMVHYDTAREICVNTSRHLCMAISTLMQQTMPLGEPEGGVICMRQAARLVCKAKTKQALHKTCGCVVLKRKNGDSICRIRGDSDALSTMKTLECCINLLTWYMVIGTCTEPC